MNCIILLPQHQQIIHTNFRRIISIRFCRKALPSLSNHFKNEFCLYNYLQNTKLIAITSSSTTTATTTMTTTQQQTWFGTNLGLRMLSCS